MDSIVISPIPPPPGSIELALYWLSQSPTGNPIYDYIIAHDIIIEQHPPYGAVYSWWDKSRNLIVLAGYLAAYNPKVVAPTLAHEGTHAIWDQCNSIDEEYHCFEASMKVWVEIKGDLTDSFLDSLVSWFAQGEEYVKSMIRSTWAYAHLPEYCP